MNPLDGPDQWAHTPNTPGQKAAAAKRCQREARTRDELVLFLSMLGLMEGR